MKKSFRLLLTALWLVLFPLSHAAQEDNQVIIKGRQTLVTLDIPDKISSAIIDFDSKDSDSIVQNFEARVSAHQLKMFADISEFGVLTELKDEHAGEMKKEAFLRSKYKTMLSLSFNPSGENLFMKVYSNHLSFQKKKPITLTNPKPERKMVKIIDVQVPRSGTVTTSETLEELINSGGSSGPLWNGYQTTNYSLSSKTRVSKQNFQVNGNRPSSGTLRKNTSKLRLAHINIGTDILIEFYRKLNSGGFDLAGADQGSILAAILNFLDTGTPIEILESQESLLIIENEESAIRVGIASDHTEIFSIETKYVDLESENASTVGSENPDTEEPTNSSMTNATSQGTFGSGSQNDQDATASSGQSSDDASSDGGCDCSCEKYAELMAMGKKKKKDRDMSQMQQIDMNCIQSCTMAWANCARKKK